MKTKKPDRPEWPVGKQIPSFKSSAEEEAFWLSHSFDDVMDAKGEELKYEPQATRRPRKHVYNIRFDYREMAVLQDLAKQRGVTVSVIIREFVRERVVSAATNDGR